jgi:hypothetical protein
METLRRVCKSHTSGIHDMKSHAMSGRKDMQTVDLVNLREACTAWNGTSFASTIDFSSLMDPWPY